MSNTYAILISVDNYHSDDISNLPFCNNDLLLMKDAMTKNLGILSENVLLLGETPNSKVTRSEILRAINFTQKISKDVNTLIFYFTGHGTSYNKEGYLVAYDTEIDLPADTSIPLSRIIDEFKNTHIKNKLLIIDSCFSGIDFSKGVKNIFEDFDENVNQLLSEGWTLLASCKGTEFSYLYPEKNVSVFTYYLSEAINELSPKSGSSSVQIEEINDYTFKRVAKWALENKKSQTPNLRSERVGSLALQLIRDENQHRAADLANFDVPVIEEKSTKLVLLEQRFFKSFETFEPIILSGLNSNFVTSTVIPYSPEERKPYTVSYTEQERSEKLEKYQNGFLETFFADAINFIKPSQIQQIGPKKYQLPFCELELTVKDAFTSVVRLTVRQSEIDEKAELFLKKIDNHANYHWKTLEYSFKGNFDFDLLVDRLIENEYKIDKYDIDGSKIVATFGTKKDRLKLRFQNSGNESVIAVEDYSELPNDFFEILPTNKIIQDFYETINK